MESLKKHYKTNLSLEEISRRIKEYRDMNDAQVFLDQHVGLKEGVLYSTIFPEGIKVTLIYNPKDYENPPKKVEALFKKDDVRQIVELSKIERLLELIVKE